MCIIVDTNVAHKFTQPPDEAVKPVIDWLLSKKQSNQLAVGGRLRKELFRSGEPFRRLYLQLDRVGRIANVSDELVNADEKEVAALLESLGLVADDEHVLALARVCGSRLLASEDSSSGLHAHFKDKRIVNPPGSIYQNATHRHLLKKCPPCKVKKLARRAK